MAGILTTDTYGDVIARARAHSGGNVLRDARKAEDYPVRQFAYEKHLSEIDAIHHSMRVRSGGRMRGHYRENAHAPVCAGGCLRHWRRDFGIFAPSGELVGYIGLVRTGNIATYMQIMGHGDHLRAGIMYRLHFALIEWALSAGEMAGVDLIWYTNFRGPDGLAMWKRRAGFTEVPCA